MSNLYKEVVINNTSTYEHRVVAEKLINRPLKSTEDVHHKDGDKNNNNDDNLIVFISRSAHISFHHGGELIPTNEKYVFDCKAKIPHCEKCGARVNSRRAKMCLKCAQKVQRKVPNRPTHDKLKELLEYNSYCAVGRLYNVSDNTIRKWLKSPE